uniref:DUF4806 domain-containing protein n=1 Tax=Trichobilharzia regenti TaxID=157069 RepID=A0AA85JUI0_TRIRE|nr:unnamed protein product [Trichobilharzia regenti]
MLSEDLCLYHSSITDNEVEACVRPRPEWVLTDCQMLAELDSFVEAKNTLQATKRIHSVLSNSDNMEETLPLTNSKRPRVETKNSSYAYDSMELEAVEAQKVCLPSKYPTTNFMETVMSPIASTSTQQMPVATSSPIAQPVQQTTKENCESDNKVANELQSLKGEMQSLKGEMHSFKGEMKAELQSLKTMMAQLLSVNKSTGVAAVGSGKSTIDNSQLQFPVTTEEEFTQLEASLKNPKFKESFMMKMVEKLSFNPESSLRAMLNYVMEPKLSSRFTAFGTPKKLALTKCTFYAVITSVIVSKFVSATISDDDVKKILKKTVKAYFHDIRDRIDKRESRRRVAVDNKKSDQRISPVSYHLNKYML